ncbi:MAG: hypothetical protein KDJ34_04350 [Candidatus Competibacteraceae bacterium]|nr:hypothetical protein [Candidatus Competibacteraceae bacterium]MCP5133832.1 hypothetical protein [Gammaproteobacteria bacterium]
MNMQILILFLTITLPASTLAESRLERRLSDLERRVKMLEEQTAYRGGMPSGLLQQTPQGFSGKFIEPASSTGRWIRFSTDGTFLLHTPADRFTGTWEKSGVKISVRVPAGFAEEFRIAGETLVDSRNITWIKAKSQ